jgi:hypothetical protein
VLVLIGCLGLITYISDIALFLPRHYGFVR